MDKILAFIIGVVFFGGWLFFNKEGLDQIENGKDKGSSPETDKDGNYIV